MRNLHQSMLSNIYMGFQVSCILGRLNGLTLSKWGGWLSPTPSQWVLPEFQVYLWSRVSHPFGVEWWWLGSLTYEMPGVFLASVFRTEQSSQRLMHWLACPFCTLWFELVVSRMKIGGIEEIVTSWIFLTSSVPPYPECQHWHLHIPFPVHQTFSPLVQQGGSRKHS